MGACDLEWVVLEFEMGDEELAESAKLMRERWESEGVAGG